MPTPARYRTFAACSSPAVIVQDEERGWEAVSLIAGHPPATLNTPNTLNTVYNRLLAYPAHRPRLTA